MIYIKDTDYDYIMNKYHDATKAEQFDRFFANEQIFDESTGLSADEIEHNISAINLKYDNFPHSVIKARAFEYILHNTQIACDERDMFPAICAINRILQRTLISKWHQDVFDNKIPQTKHEKEELEARGALSIYLDYDHSAPNWERLFQKGLSGVIEDVKVFKTALAKKHVLSEDVNAFYESIEIEYNAFIKLIIRMAHLADNNNPKLALALNNIAKDKPTTFYEALLLNYLFFIVIEHIDCMQARTLGNFDSLFAPYYFADIEKGKSEEELRTELAYYLFQFQSINNYWGQPTYLGGTNKDGTTVINELSYAFLDVYDKMGLYNPKLQLKISDETPKSIVLKALDMIRRGNNSIVFVCDKVIRAAFDKLGVDQDTAREYVITGCYAAYIQDAVPLCCTYVNIMKPFEYTLSGGYDNVTGALSGIETSTEFDTFEGFYNTYLMQLKECLESVMEIEYSMTEFNSYINPQSLLSGITASSIEKGVDILNGGATRAATVVCCGGIANVCDSLAAIRELVFESKRYTLKELKEILDSDFKDNEELRLEMLHKLPHFGNDDDSVDEIVKDVLSFICDTVTTKKGRFGFNYSIDTHVARHSYYFGKQTAASPDGRHFGDELSKNSSATIGRAVKGPTAAIMSATKINVVDFCGGDSCLDLGLHPTAVKGEEGLEAMYSMIMVYAKRGGFAIHMNVFNAETLRDAQKHPEKYEDLQIRVSGWNVLFNNINKEEQDGFIRQAEGLE